jgi:tetratricopeptide (TPR) repeat protein
VNSFYSHPGPQALDRLKRAQALARAIGHVELQALCAAWLAHLEFNANRMETMVQHAAEALRLAAPEHHAALARASLVVADAYHFAGRFDLAKDWYAAVRRHALAEGDDAMISAMLHNVATFRASNVRISELFSTLDKEQAALAMMQAQSTTNYDLGIGTASLTWFVPLIRAQLLTSEGKYDEAAALFAAHLDDAKKQGLSRLLPSFYADYAWCCQRLGRVDMAGQYLELALLNAQQGCDPDDLAATFARAEHIARDSGEDTRADALRKTALSSLAEHRDAQEKLRDLLAETLGEFVPLK